MNEPITLGHRPLRVLHVLAISLPHINGYTIRSKYLVETQRRDGLEPLVVTSPYYPGREASRVDTVLDGTHYVRVRHPDDESGPWNLERIFFGGWDSWVRFGGLDRLKALAKGTARTDSWSGAAQVREAPAGEQSRGLLRLFRDHRWAVSDALLRRRFERGLERVVRRFRPDLIHAHSPYHCGLPALRVARRHGLPFVYETRGMWEESRVASEGEASRGSRTYRWWHEAESTVMTRADAVVCIGDTLRDEVIGRGVPPARVVVVPNGVDPAVFRPSTAVVAEAAEQIRDVRGRLRGLTLGYIGSLRQLEGVDELVRGTAELFRRGHDVSLLVVGHSDGYRDRLRAVARELGLGERAVFLDRVPHDQIAFYYDVIDVFVISRPLMRVTNVVTPLKPLEAMAMAKPLVVSDLAALHELVIEGETGLFYPPGDVPGLADVCARLLDDAALRRQLGEAARRWVMENRTWPIVLRRLYPTYASMAGRAVSSPREGRRR